ncbi:hypothetical protein [Haloferula sp.]|uniref:hypothetical protein n=1 Tax=Haloferula sp. TaxID=2497595 RepID=UPI003C791259
MQGPTPVQDLRKDPRKLRANRPIVAGSNYFGIEGGTNDLALYDADGADPADEVLEIELGVGHGLSGIDFVWTRGLLSLSGFSGDPGADRGSYDGDRVPLALEYARGSDPLRSDAAGWQEFDLPSRSLSCTRNPEALGTWTVETSLDLQTWNPTTLSVDPSPDRLTVPLSETLPERGFFRTKFIPESTGN